ncbi:MAG: hypothetical protein QF426_06395 [Verrucomicrobiales bacterium]|jgi:hypothetical protein|nr:hypothetical protein [Verrucomicrobiales bacterium]MDP6859434.1 hypothetical protein [Verrucomicrobiales bacterium]
MTTKEDKKYGVFLMVLIPIAIIFLGYLFSKDPGQSQGKSQKKASSIYSIWLTEAEVAPTKKDQSQWDVDGTAPDLSAMVVWKDQIILNTVTSNDSLIARWDPIAISVGDVFQGEVSTSTVKRIARIRAEKGEKFSIGLFDEDIVSRDYVGGWEIDTSELRTGTCELTSKGTLNRLIISVTQDDNLTVPDRESKLKGATYLEEPTDIMLETVKRWANEAKESVKELGNNVGEKIEEIGEQVEEQRNRIEEAIKETSKKTEDKIREMLDSLRNK